MAKENSSEKSTPKERIGYGVKIPIVSFEEAIRITKDVSIKGGLDGSIDALAEVTNNTVSSSTFTKKIGNLKNFSLLSSVDKEYYHLSDLGKHIAQPESKEQEVRAIQDAFIKNDILNKIWENYKGKILPQKEYLANFIEKSLEIPPTLKHLWASYFIDGALFAGLIREKEAGSFQVLSTLGYIKGLDKQTKIEEKSETTNQTFDRSNSTIEKPISKFPDTSSFENQGISIRKKISGNRIVFIYVPEDLTEKDIENIKSILKSVEAGLDGLKIYDES